MTTPSTERKAGPLLGTGAQTTWPFTFKVFAVTDIAVTIATSLGVETALVYGTDYSVALNANQETSPGGTVTYPISGTPLPTGSRLVIVGNLPYDQPLDLPAGGNFSPLALENELDRLTMQIQQLRENVSRALQVSVSTGADVGLPAPSANELIGWDSTGSTLQNFALSELATAVAYATMRYDTFTGDGVETQFTLTADPVTLANLDVAISGVTQVPGSDYSLVNGALVFASAPANGTEILARYGEGLVNVGGNSSDIRYLPVSGSSTDVQTRLRLHDKKLAEFVSITDFGAVAGTDSTTAIQTAINSGADEIYVPEGTFNYSATINITSKVRLFGPGTLNETVLLDAGILVAGVDGVRIQGLTFTGPETLAAWNAGGGVYRQSYKSFIKFDGCKNGVVDNVISSGKRGTVWLLDCQKMTVQGIRHNGFLGSLTAPPVTDSNYYEVVFVQDGLENRVLNCEGFSCGNVVLIGLESSYNIVSEISGREIQDALIYNSSGTNSTFTNSTVNVCTNGLIIRGSGHTVANNVIFDSDQLGIALTGNGSTPDGYNSNGFGTVCTGNTLSNPNGYAIAIVEQDGLYPRDFIISDNTVEAHIGTAGFAAILIAAERGIKVVNNIVRGSTANYALGIFGVSAGNRAFNFDVSGNTITSAVQAIRMAYVDDSMLSGNLTSDISGGLAIEARLCDNNMVTNNVVPATKALKFSSSAGEECYDNIITVNKATVSADSVDNTVANNY